MTNVKIDLIKFKRGNKSVLDEKLVGDKKPQKGEPIWEIDSNKIKIGDGENNYKNLPYLTGSADGESIIYRGWYNNKDKLFYKDSGFSERLPFNPNKIYIDNGSALIYYYNKDGSPIYHPILSPASAEHFGVAKLYSDKGTETDGSITQAKITELCKGIKLTVGSDETLILSNPWED